MKENESIIIMAGGASSRMKRSVASANLSETTKTIALKYHKSLIPLGKEQRPLLYHLIQNAVSAGYREVYLITSPENEAFQHEVGTAKTNNAYAGAKVHYAIQYTPANREKPLGTADAVQQAMDQYPELKTATFTVCNGDNLYSVKALAALREERLTPHALISYARSGLQFPDERITKFAVMEIDAQGHVMQIIEKPDPNTVKAFADSSGEIRVSMNIFNFSGELLYPYLVSCPIHPERLEKELPEAVRRMIKNDSFCVLGIPFSEHLPDLTSAEDINAF